MRGQVAWFPIDHIVPRSRGGKTETSNLALACPRCNAHKWAHTNGEDPETGAKFALFNPRTQSWDEHFRLSQIAPYHIEALSPIGRATIGRLCMNDAEIVVIRGLLVELGIIVL